MSCQRHPDYDPASGEPTEDIQPYFMGEYGGTCGDCWQARAKWLDKNVTMEVLEPEEIKRLRERIAELEGQLAKVKGKLDSTQWEHSDCREREAVLREAFQEAVDEFARRGMCWIDEDHEDWLIRARAALEVK